MQKTLLSVTSLLHSYLFSFIKFSDPVLCYAFLKCQMIPSCLYLQFAVTPSLTFAESGDFGSSNCLHGSTQGTRARELKGQP